MNWFKLKINAVTSNPFLRDCFSGLPIIWMLTLEEEGGSEAGEEEEVVDTQGIWTTST